jgi:hypothetical protein
LKGLSHSHTLLKELSYLLLGKMDHQKNILVEEKIAGLQGIMRQMKDEKLLLQSEIDLLSKEKNILLGALDQYTAMEKDIDELKTKNIELESQLKSMMSAIEYMEQEFKRNRR